MSFEHPVGQKNRNKIIKVLMIKGEISPKDLKVYLDDLARKRIEASNKIEDNSPVFKKLVKKESMTYRAMMGHLERLTTEGYVKRRGHRYSLSKMKWDFLSTVEALGNLSFVDLMSDFKYKNRETLIQNLVLYFGAFMVYIFLISLEPIEGMPKSRLIFELLWRSQNERKIGKAKGAKAALPVFLFYYYFQTYLLLFDINKTFKIRPYLPDSLDTPIVGDFDFTRSEYNKLMEVFKKSYPTIYESLKNTENKLYKLITEPNEK